MSTKNYEDTEYFRKNLKILMQKEGIRQKDLAKMIGITDSTFSAVMNGKSYPTFSQLITISERFSVSLNWLLRDIGDPKIYPPGEEPVDPRIVEEWLGIKKKIEIMEDLLRHIIKNIHFDGDSGQKIIDALDQLKKDD